MEEIAEMIDEKVARLIQVRDKLLYLAQLPEKEADAALQQGMADARAALKRFNEEGGAYER